MLDLTERDKCFVIAEAGTSHRGMWPLAEDLVEAAADAGADAIKFQIFNAPVKDDMFCWIDGDEKRIGRWEDSALSLAMWEYVKEIAEKNDIMFLASVFQHSTVEWLNELGVEATKVASRAAKDFPYGKSPEPYLISDGMYPWGDWIDAVSGKNWYQLQCEANYPSRQCWDETTTIPGFSDHSGTPWRVIDAISRGCKLIEVHFYINEEDAGPDLPASLDLDQLKLVCEARDNFAEIRNA